MSNEATIRASIDVAIKPAAAFDVIVGELKRALRGLGLLLEVGAHGKITQGNFEVGRIVTWVPGERIVLKWRQASWEPEQVTQIELKFEPLGDGTRIMLEHPGWGQLIGTSDETAGWFSSEVVAPLLRSMAPTAFGDWITDRRARRPSGAQSSAFYRDPLYHYPNFRVILAELALSGNDHLLEVACGGGAFLKDALRSGCRAAAVDHSPSMVELAREENKEAVRSGRLVILEASADHLPFPDAIFTCATMTGVLGFLPDPVAAVKEICRTLAKGGRVVIQGTDPEMRGTPAAPEPVASRLRFYDDDELGNLARETGFSNVRVVRRNLEPYAREAGVPEEHLPLFTGMGSRFLLASKE